MKQTMNLKLLKQCKPLDDDTLDTLLRHYSGLEYHETIAYISSIQIDSALNCDKQGQIKTKDDALKKLGPSLRNKFKVMEGLVILVHGPNEGSPVVYGQNQNNHWSILYYHRLNHRFYHYDSLENFNDAKNRQIIGLLVKYDIVPREGIVLFVPDFIPQQPGSWECSYFCVIYCHILCSKRYSYPISSNDVFKYLSNDLFNMSFTSTLRQNILSFANDFHAQQNQLDAAQTASDAAWH
jgi:hypothetical protein